MDKNDIRKMLEEQRNPTITPEEENTRAKSIRNYLIDTIGLPDTWSQSEADVKRFDAGLPMQMGMGAMGSIGKMAMPRMAKQIQAPAIKNVAAANATHEVEKVAAQKAMDRLGAEGVQKGTSLFKDLFKKYKNEGM